MVKVSITLPNTAQITLESEESEVIQQVISMALRDLPLELMHSSVGANSVTGHEDEPQSSGSATNQDGAQPDLNVVEQARAGTVGVAGPAPSSPPVETGIPEATASNATGLASGPAAAIPGQTRSNRSATPNPPQTRRETTAPGVGSSGADETPAARRVASTASEKRFARFCANAAPLGDMRKVVVAADGAKLFLDMASVDATDLAGLFDLAGWRIPHNFIQTLRNAARDKYRWLERVPGRSGRYTATELGRTVTSSD